MTRHNRPFVWANTVVSLSFASVLLAFGSCFPVVEAADTSDQGIPPTIESSSGYAWVGAGSLLNPDGSIRYEYLADTPSVADKLAKAMRDKELGSKGLGKLRDKECSSLVFSPFDGPGASTVEEFVNGAELVFSGRIVAMEQGFSTSISGTLFRVEVEEILKASPEFDFGETVFVFYPHSRFAVHGAQFCRGRFPGDYVPEVGDGVVVMTNSRPIDLRRELVWTTPWEVFFEDSSTGEIIDNPALWRQLELNSESVDIMPFLGEDARDFRDLCEQIKSVLTDTQAPRRSQGWYGR